MKNNFTKLNLKNFEVQNIKIRRIKMALKDNLKKDFFKEPKEPINKKALGFLFLTSVIIFLVWYEIFIHTN